jgi:hypothetical protein
VGDKERESPIEPTWLLVVAGVIVAAYLIYRFAIAYWAANT